MLLTRVPALGALALLVPLTGQMAPPARAAEPAATPATTPAAAPAAGQVPARTAEDAKLMAFLGRAWEEDLARDPTRRTVLGLPGDQSRWTPVSDAFEQEEGDVLRRRLQQLETELTPSGLSGNGKLTLRLYKARLDERLAELAIQPDFYRFHRLNSPHTSMVTVLANNHRVRSIRDAEDYVARLNAMPQVLDDIVAATRARFDRGIVLPAYNYPSMAESARNVVGGRPFEDGPADSVIWADFQKKLDALDASADEKERLRAAARSALTGTVGPAYRRFAEAMQDMAAKAGHTDGIWALPRGAEFYRTFVRLRTTVDLSPDEIHDIGLKEVARIQREMRGIMERVGFKGDLQAFFQHLKTAPDFYLPDTEAGHQAYLAKADAVLSGIKAKLPDWFGVLPRAELEVRPVEKFRENSTAGAFYNAPSLDGSRPGIFYANMSDMKTLPLWDLETLAYHEGIPGHHLQIAIRQEMKELPEFRRTTGYTAFNEGWALYAEALGKEMGLFQDPYSDAGRLAAELFRAVRLVVDTGLHHKRWSRDQAITYMNDNLPSDAVDNTREVERYLNWPGQALGYKIGMLEIQKLRAHAQQVLGPKFDIRGFHDVVLKSGGVPLPVLGDLVEDWIRARRGA